MVKEQKRRRGRQKGEKITREIYEGEICGEKVKIYADAYTYVMAIGTRTLFSGDLEFLFREALETITRKRLAGKQYRELTEMFKELKAIKEEIKAELEKVFKAIE
jgi:hypothetical protein